jgi:DNA (cytosine-5)-methyltransferase 1|nr:MAG TPA: Cytosine specific methyltransferase [Caudoviricetes sp.]
MKFIDFFSGVGGFTHGMELAGHECIGHCEFDKYAEASYRSMHTITDKQREYLLTLPLRQRQKEILKDEYLNGEWYANDVRRVIADDIPRAECWCFGFPCQDISIAGHQHGFKGNRSNLFFRITNLIEQLKEEDRPNTLFIENVKNLLSVNRGLDFARLLVELDKIGYDAEWEVINSKHHGVPQNRERVFIIGRARGTSRCEVFPFEESGGENCIKQIGRMKTNNGRDNPNQYRVYDPKGIGPCLGTCGGGGLEPHIIQPFGIDKSCNNPRKIDIANCITAQEDSGVSNHKAEGTAVAIPVITPERANKRQNGRRFKENGEPSFTLTAQDRHGVAISVQPNDKSVDGEIKVKQATKKGYTLANKGDSINLAVPNSTTRRGRVGEQVVQTLDTSCNQGVVVELYDDCSVWATWSEKYNCYLAIRKLTPRESFRLQGWEDKYFERAEQLNSNNQLYKQAGNGVTVNVIKHIAERM